MFCLEELLPWKGLRRRALGHLLLDWNSGEMLQLLTRSKQTNGRPALMAHSYRLRLITWRYLARVPVGPGICHRGCSYTVLQNVQRPGVYRAIYGTVHYKYDKQDKEPLKLFEIKVGHSLGFGLPSVAILRWLYRKRLKAIFTHTQRYIMDIRTCVIWS